MSLKVLLAVTLLMTAVTAQEMELDPMEDISNLSSDAMAAARIQMNFDAAASVQARSNNFFCLERMTFYDPSTGQVNINYTQFEQINDRVWTLYVQMPILGYLDVTRKRALIDIVVTVLGGGMSPSNVSEVCIGTYEIYSISTFDESILIHLYSRPTSTPFNVGSIVSQFQRGVDAAYGDGGNTMVIDYPGQPGVVTFNLTASPLFSSEVLYAGDTSSDGAVPINLAVYLGSYANNVTFTSGISGVSESFGSRPVNRRAENPNPINYGLEAGDIVFAIFGSILLLIVTLLIFLGYCIHPFFLA